MPPTRANWWFLFEMPEERFDGAACTSSDVDPDWWTESLEDTDPKTLRRHQRTAMATCMSCPCLKQCALYAIKHPELQGIWGGTNDRQRRDLRSGKRYTTLNILY